MKRMKNQIWQDAWFRFLAGGTVLIIVYGLTAILPWKTLAGAFAAFPGVLGTAVALAGWRQGDQTAADVSAGAVWGMLGGLICVLVTVFVLSVTGSWWFSLAGGIVIWFVVSLGLNLLVNKGRPGAEPRKETPGTAARS